ncbi:methylcytosine dioxygenase TET2 [Scleropages formosus]|uniref:Methylcytosine dioxygenase TET n=1 Tax=Scleropages formosus TaxID=113540 RepID=A0A8C9V6C3_SCLFO|nr:methylcytosine dioxygenase TET2 [Scleropages formosus]
METEKASHEMGDTLLLAQFGSVRQTENLVVKLQNGSQLPEVSSYQINGDGDWNHFKPNAEINQTKKLCEHSPSPAGIQDPSDQHPRMTNGDLKHVLSESASHGLQPPKKPRVDSGMNGEDDQVVEKAELATWDKKQAADLGSDVDCFPELVRSTDFKHDVLAVEQKPEKKSCCFPNGDIFSLARNKQVPISNGATMTSSNMEDTPGDLLEKTLSQYYPDHVSIAPQSCRAHENTIGRTLAKDTHKQAIQTSLLTSGLPGLSQVAASGEQSRKSLEGHGDNVYSAGAAVNGYSSQSDEENQQKQQQQQKPYPRLDVPVSEEPQVLVPEEQNPAAKPGDGLLGENGAESFPTHAGEQGVKQTFSDGSSAPAAEARHMDGTEVVDRSSPSGSSPAGLVIEAEDSQSVPELRGPQQSLVRGQYGAQESEIPSAAESSNQQGPTGLITGPPPLKSTDATLHSPGGPIPESHPSGTQTQGSGTENGVHFNREAENVSRRAETYPGMNWIDLSSSIPPWQREGFRSHSRQEQGSLAQSQRQVPGISPMLRSPQLCSGLSGSQQQAEQVPGGYSAKLAQDQAENKATGEWQGMNGDSPSSQQTQSTVEGSKMFMPHSCSLSQEQLENPYHSQMQEKHLVKHIQNLEGISCSGFIRQQPPHRPHAEFHPTLEAQDPQQTAPSQPQDPGQMHLENNLMERLKLEEHRRLEEQIKTEKKCHNEASQQQRPGFTQCDSHTSQSSDSLPHKGQPQSKETVPFGFGKRDGAPVQEVIQQIQYPRQPLVHQQQQGLESFQQLQQPPPLQPQPQPQLPHGALNQQVPQNTTCQVQPKLELQESCVQFQQGETQTNSHGDLQRHAILRMQLLQRQEKQGLHPSFSNSQSLLRAIKSESCPRFEAPKMQPSQGPETSAMQVRMKQEPTQVPCGEGQRSNITAIMEHQLRQYQPSTLFERKPLVMKSPGKIKFETSGAVTVLSANADLSMEDSRAEALKRSADGTPTKKVKLNLNSFLESPIKLLDTPIKNLVDTPVKTQYEIPSCHCIEQLSEKDEGPYYTHLGAAPNVAGIREIMEKRFGQTGSCIRIEKVVYTGKEGKSTLGCPIAKWVIRRSGVEEKLLVLVRERAGHSCATACLVVAILIWEGIPTSLADRLYSELSETLRKHGAHTYRRCGLNEERTCTCQGLDPNVKGASFSFGCSWSMYYNGCKFARSKVPRKFKLLGDDAKEEERLEQNLQHLATLMAPTYKKLAPDAYGNQVEYEDRALDCRLGLKEGRPFSGVTACLDFCAHAHRDLHNMPSGSTVVCTLTREDNREIGKIPEDEQLHVLPLYTLSPTDEFGSAEAQQDKMKSGAIQVLSTFRRQVRILAEPAKSCRQKKLDSRRVAANKVSNQDVANSKTEKALQGKLKQSTPESTIQSTLMSGSLLGQASLGAPQPGHPGHSLDAQQQHPQQQQLQQQPQNHPPSLPGSSHARLVNHANSFPSTSQSANISYPQSSASPYPGHMPNTCLNGSDSPNPHPAGSINPSSLYPGYQGRGTGPMDSFHRYDSTNPKHPDMYRLQRPQLYPQQHYGTHHRYGVNLPPQYGDPSLQINGCSNGNMRPSVPSMGPYQTYGPSSGPQHMEAIIPPPSGHPGLDYGTASKGSQFGGYTNSYVAQNNQMTSPGQDHLRMQNKPEMNLHGPGSIVQSLPLASDCPTSTQPGFGTPGGNVPGTQIKQEPGVSTPDPKETEDVWSDNEHNFLDPEIGGVAVAPSHGSILIECAKREMHATTPLKNPDRNHPTRISLVFYQHKNMNEAKHGLALWEAKMAEKAREKEEDTEKHGADGTPSKNKKVKREHSDGAEHGEPPYKRFIQTLMQKSMSCTTNTYVSTAPYAFSKVTGPYNRFI